MLKRGGRLMVLEFSHMPNNTILKKIYDEYSFHLIPKFGNLVAGDSESYKYLVESIRRFPKQVMSLSQSFATYDTFYITGKITRHDKKCRLSKRTLY